MKNGVVASEFKEGVLEKKARGVSGQGLNGMWNNIKGIIVQETVKVFGRGTPGEPKGREEWWWSDEVQEAVKEKRMAFKEENNRRGDIEAENRYKKAKMKAKKAVARAKAEASTDWYEELETKESQQKIFRIAKAMERSKKHLGDIAICRTEMEIL